ncbi:MAG: CBS domain-containing protein [Pirellulales bacterium]|nr:CBS domain-containing protein [Pirellulales bacterium]
MLVQDILRAKGTRVHTIDPSVSVEETVETLVRNNVGSLVVCDADGHMLGIVSERDILRCIAKHRGGCSRLSVRDLMTKNVVTGTPSDDIATVMGLMTDHRIRHLPITEEDRLVGIVSIGDVVKAQRDEMALENHYLKSYIQS